MHLAMLGLCHPETPVEVREQAGFSAEELPGALAELLARPMFLEGAILSTCNRIEIYVVAFTPEAARAHLSRFLLNTKGLAPDLLDRHGRFLEQEQAVRHLFRVAAGLESQILGEGQILKQVKEAHRAGQEQGAIGPMLDGLFRAAISAGKRVRTETDLGRGDASTASAAVALAERALETLAGRSALVLGTGRIAELAAKHLATRQLAQITIAGRHLASAERLAATVPAQATPFSDLRRTLEEVDLLLCATGAPHHVLTASDLAPVAAGRQGRRLLVIDLSVPRNIDPGAASLPWLTLHDIDDLENVAEPSPASRGSQVAAAERLLAEETETFRDWLKNHRMRGAFTALRTKLEDVRRSELRRFWQKYDSHFSASQRDLVEQLTERLMSKVYHGPVSNLRRMSPPQQHQHVETLDMLFDLEIGELTRPVGPPPSSEGQLPFTSA